MQSPAVLFLLLSLLIIRGDSIGSTESKRVACIEALLTGSQLRIEIANDDDDTGGRDYGKIDLNGSCIRSHNHTIALYQLSLTEKEVRIDTYFWFAPLIDGDDGSDAAVNRSSSARRADPTKEESAVFYIRLPIEKAWGISRRECMGPFGA